VIRDDLERVFARYAPPDAAIVIVETSEEGDLGGRLTPELATASVVVAAGGDGTVSEVAASVAGTSIPLGIIPCGTTNMIAKVNLIPSGIDASVALLFGPHRVKSIDVGRSGDRVLIHLGGSGLDARVFQRANPEFKRRLGWLAYAPPLLASLGNAGSRVTVTVDGASITIRSRLVLIGNDASLIHRRFAIMPDVHRDDGLFDVLIFTANGWPAIVRSAASIAAMRSDRSADLVHLRGRSIAIDADPPLSYEFDGDVIGETPFEITVEPGALRVICGQ
jgi:diacylglycerol kinase family enzyme